LQSEYQNLDSQEHAKQNKKPVKPKGSPKKTKGRAGDFKFSIDSLSESFDFNSQSQIKMPTQQAYQDEKEKPGRAYDVWLP
jgi:hypothetical protein